MRITDQVDWEAVDFALAGILLFGVGLAYELVVRTNSAIAYRAAVGIALAAGLSLIWITGAVGIIGSANHDANLLYGVVLAVGIIGAVIARLRAGGMARALLAVALAQTSIALIAVIGGLGSEAANWPRDVLSLTGLFVALWLVSAWLFKRAARAPMHQPELELR